MAKVIENREQLIEAVKNIAAQTTEMCKRIIGVALPISSLTVFSHDQREFESLCKMLESMGESFDYNNGPRVKLTEPIKAGSNDISFLRIRRPDPERPQVGCNDFDTDFESFKDEYLVKYPDNLILIERPGYDMIEMRDEGFDVLAYIVSNFK